MKLLTNLLLSIVASFLIIGLAIWLVPGAHGELAPMVTFRYTTSIPEIAHMVKVGDEIVDTMGTPIMRVSSVSIRSLQSAIVMPSGTVAVVNNPQMWEVTFSVKPVKEGIIPDFVIGGSVYIQTDRWRKLVRVIKLEGKQ